MDLKEHLNVQLLRNTVRFISLIPHTTVLQYWTSRFKIEIIMDNPTTTEPPKVRIEVFRRREYSPDVRDEEMTHLAQEFVNECLQ